MASIGPYEIREELGRGGVGVVYRAHDPRLGRDVAIKMLIAVDASPTQLARFGREARALARLRHPNVVALHEVGHDPQGRPYLVLDLVSGVTLASRIEQGGPLPAREAAELVRKLAEGLAVGHAQGILHRDVKPENVILTADGEPHLTDFGLAKDLASSQAGSLSIQGRFIGTPGYWSPEQATGDEAKMGSATDVYGLGATLFAMLTGRPVFQCNSVSEAIVAALAQPAEPPSKVRDGIPPALDAIVRRCLEKEPAHRFRGGSELAEALAGFLSGAVGAPEVAPPRATRVRGEAGAGAARPVGNVTVVGAVAVAAALLGAIGGAVLARRPGGASDEPAEPGQTEAYLQAELDRATTSLARVEGELRAARVEMAGLQRGLDEAESQAELRRHYDGARAKMIRRDLDGALAEVDAAIALDPTRVTLWCLRADVREMRGDLAGARADYERAVEVDPSSGMAWEGLGMVRQRAGELDEALAALDEAIRLDPDRATSWLNRAVVRLAREELADARGDADEAIRLEPRLAKARCIRAAVMDKTGDRAGALVEIERAIDADPTHADAWKWRGLLRAASGDPAGAIDDLELAIRLGSKDAEALRSELKRLQGR